MIYQAFLKLAEKMNGAEITGQLAKDCLWIVSALFSFWFLVLLALTPYLIIRLLFKRK
ncbi:MAG: hypothetical protein I3273_02635 [Candidatus Moeniiplasma glomeromycotorum]|nr:hypothetical protein [Candidatus Moeniiplasma glomeromycotorum]MCE8167647.1 hypothetical protein [Candidatus Moeniiplasma glomeromycotorum]MCE8169002.1 hypothetical protein [Candidatus Moeniiplasma glomeromycotorum]